MKNKRLNLILSLTDRIFHAKEGLVEKTGLTIFAGVVGLIFWKSRRVGNNHRDFVFGNELVISGEKEKVEA